jgi:hypothetical protein
LAEEARVAAERKSARIQVLKDEQFEILERLSRPLAIAARRCNPFYRDDNDVRLDEITDELAMLEGVPAVPKKTVTGIDVDEYQRKAAEREERKFAARLLTAEEAERVNRANRPAPICIADDSHRYMDWEL